MTRFKIIALCIALLCPVIPPSTRAADLTLVDQGRSEYTIVTAVRPTPAEALAAEDLAKYVQALSGARLKIIAADDEAPPRSLSLRIELHQDTSPQRPSDVARSNDAFTIRADAQGRILLRATDDRGLLHATYALLNRLGCRFLAPQFDHYNGSAEFIPHRPTLVLPADVTIESRPVLAYRKLYVEEGISHDEASLRRLIEWMPKVGYNVLVVPADYQNHGRVKWDNWRAALTPELQRRGIIIEVGGHGYQNFLNANMPAPDAPGKALVDLHPDWFAADASGQRHREPNWVFNTASPDAVRFMVDRLVDYVRQRPEIQIFDLWPPDGERWDESAEGTKQGTPTDRMVLLTNLVRAQLAKVRPDLRVECIAYARYTSPPITRRLDPSVLVDFCPINQSFEYPLAEPASPRNATYAKDVQGWRRAFAGDISLYSYYRKYAWGSLPVLLPHYLQGEMRYVAGLPLQGVSTYSEPGDWFTYELNHYALVKLAWNPQFDVDALIREFCAARYGPAADAARRAFAALEDVVRTCGSIPFTPLKSAEQLDAGRRRLEQVDADLTSAAASATDPATRRNIQRLRLTVDYATRDLHLQALRATNAPAADRRRDAEALRAFLLDHRGDGVFVVTDQRPTLTSLLKRYDVRDR